MMPVLLVFLAALIEFGLVLANTKVVALSSRTGAKLAAESPAFNMAQVTTGVNAALATANMSSCKVSHEHQQPQQCRAKSDNPDRRHTTPGTVAGNSSGQTVLHAGDSVSGFSVHAQFTVIFRTDTR